MTRLLRLSGLFLGASVLAASATSPSCLRAGQTGSVGGVPGPGGWNLNPPCCKGLVDRESMQACEQKLLGGYEYACLACGDQRCDKASESACNCPEDCKEAKKTKP